MDVHTKCEQASENTLINILKQRSYIHFKSWGRPCVLPNLCLFPLSHFSNLVFDVITFTGDAKENRFMAEKDEYGADTMTEIHIIGRIVLNLWRVMKTEVYLTFIPPEFQS